MKTLFDPATKPETRAGRLALLLGSARPLRGVLKQTTSEAQQTYQEEHSKEIQARAEKINQIINALFVPISILMLFWCLYNLWKRKRKKQIALEKRREALANLDAGKLFCMEKHPLDKKTISIKGLFKAGKLKKFMPVACEKCERKFPKIKAIHRCLENCNFNVCRECFRRAFSKMKVRLTNKHYEQKLESRRNHFRKNGRRKMRIGHKKKRLQLSRRLRKRLVKRIKYKFQELFFKGRLKPAEAKPGSSSTYKDRSTLHLKRGSPGPASDQSWTTSEDCGSVSADSRRTARPRSRELSRTFSMDGDGPRLGGKKAILGKENALRNERVRVGASKQLKWHTVTALRSQASKSLTHLKGADGASAGGRGARKRRATRSVFKNKVQPFKKRGRADRPSQKIQF